MLDLAIDRNNNLNKLANKAEDLKANASIFQKKTVEVKQQTQRNCIKAYATYYIIALVCTTRFFLHVFFWKTKREKQIMNEKCTKQNM